MSQAVIAYMCMYMYVCTRLSNLLVCSWAVCDLSMLMNYCL